MNKDNIYMNIVYQLASLSQDEKTHIGAIIVDPEINTVVSTGWNDFPIGMYSKSIANRPERQERPNKYNYFIHAETAAIAKAANSGICIFNMVIYTNGVPCTNCTRTIIQAGIGKVFVDKKWKEFASPKWLEEGKISEEMFYEAGIDIEEVDTELVIPCRFVDGKFWLIGSK